MENLIYNDKDETIGYYKDIVKAYEKYINDYPDEAEDRQRELDEIKEWEHYTELLVLTECNGMGFLCKPYNPNEE